MALAELLERARARGPSRPANVRLVRTAYRPWKAQAWLHRSRAVFRTVVAGRQAGKSHGGAFEAVQAALWKPGAHVAVLVPTYKIAEAVITKLKELLEPHWPDAWHEAKRFFELPGRLITIWSADRKVTVRGPTITLLWIDEGAYLHVDARDAAWGSMVAVKEARCLVTTTPAGKNWVHKEFTSPDEASESFRFRTEDSPYANLALVARLRSKMSPEKAAQEFDAVFVDNLLITFPDTRELVVEGFPSRGPTETQGNVLGVDVARDQDWTVLTLMNKFGEAEVVGRRKRPAGSEAAFYPDAVEWIAAVAKKHRAVVCIDDSGPGAVIADYLERDHQVSLIRVHTAQPKTKAKIVESCQAEVQWRRIWVRRNEHVDQLLHELSTFQGLKRVVHGQEEMSYEGPQIEGEHDDCVISLCLANWGRLNREVEVDPLAGDFSGFATDEAAPAAPAATTGELGGWGPV